MPSTTRDLLLLLAGAVFALAAQALLQLVIVPRVDTRKRREDRWERDVRELGELLTGEVARTARLVGEPAYMLWAAQRTIAAESGMSRDRRAALSQLLREHESKAREGRQAFDDATARARWLSARISALAPGSPALGHFERATLIYRHRVLNACIDGDGTGASSEDADYDEGTAKHRAAWKDERDARAELLESVEKLADGPPPRRSPPVGRVAPVARRFKGQVRSYLARRSRS